MSQRSVFLVLAAVHLAATVGLTVAAFGQGMRRFDTGGPPTPTEVAIESCGQVLRFPVVTGALNSGLRFPGVTGYLPFIVNSLLWAVVATGLFQGLGKLRRLWVPGPGPRAE